MNDVSTIPGRMAFLAAFVLLLAGPSGIACAQASPASAGAVPPALAQLSPAPSGNTAAAPMPSKGDDPPRALAPWTVSLVAGPKELWPTQYSTLTATTNQELGPTPYYLSIYDRTARTYVARCGFGTTCSVKVTQEKPGYHRYLAYVSEDPLTYPPAGLQAESFWLGESVYWYAVYSALQAVPGTLNPGENATLTANMTRDISGSPFFTSIYDATTGTLVGICFFGSSCSATVSQAQATTHRYTAYVANLTSEHPPSYIQTTSNNAYITWTNSGYRISLAHSFIAESVVRLTSTTNVDIGGTSYWTAIYNQRTGARVAMCDSLTTCTVDVAVEEGYTSFIAILASDDPALPPANIQATSDPQNVWLVRIN